MTREEAIKIVRNIYQTDAEKEALGTLVPELAESEDERIRKVIYKILLGLRKEIFTTQDEVVTKDKVLAYLEKQKEQKIFDEPKQVEWSEEDKTIIDCAVEVVEKAGLPSLAASLKSLRPQPHWKPSEQKYDGNMDKECIKLCDILNSIPSVDTFESCCGHLKDRYSIWFFCNDIITISRLGRCVERNYSDGKWELLVDSTDSHPTDVFWLRSKVPFQSYDEMEESVNGLCNCIQHWFDTKFDSYFNDNVCEETTKQEEH